MLVIVPCHTDDLPMASRVASLANACSGDHEVWMIQRMANGYTVFHTTADVPAAFYERKVPAGWPAGPTATFKFAVDRVSPGAVFLWLEPDAVLTRHSALDELERAFDQSIARTGGPRSRLCAMGHWKAPPHTPAATVEHMSGCSVYRATPEFRRAVEGVPTPVAFDLKLFSSGRLRPDMATDTDLVRCFYGFADVGKWALRKNPRAALIHGDKTGALLSHMESSAFRAARR